MFNLYIIVLYSIFLIILAGIDLKRGIIPNKLIYPAVVVAVVISLLFSVLEIVPSIGSAFAGAGIGFAYFLLVNILSKGGMGLGDVKMAGLIGLVLGYPLILVALGIAVITGGIVAVINRKSSIPFAPFLTPAAIAAVAFGNDIKDWYIGLF